MSEQIDKAKLLAYMDNEINKLPRGMMDGVMAKRISTVKGAYASVKRAIESGSLDIEPMEHERAYWAREGLIKKLQDEIESLKAITDEKQTKLSIVYEAHDKLKAIKELAVKGLKEIQSIPMASNPTRGFLMKNIVEIAKEVENTLSEIERLKNETT